MSIYFIASIAIYDVDTISKFPPLVCLAKTVYVSPIAAFKGAVSI